MITLVLFESVLAAFGFWSVVAVVATLVIWWGTDLLEASSQKLSEYYGIPNIVQGAIIVAIGSSFPELATTTLSTALHGDFELGVAAIVGSAIFNILVIPPLACLFAEGKTMDVSRALVFKEAQFYIISVAALLLVFSFGVIYFPVGASGTPIEGEINRLLALFPMLLYGLYVFLQYHDTMDFEGFEDLSFVNPWKEWAILALSLGIIVVGVEFLVQSAIRFGELFGTPSFLWGMTIVAAGTSVPDAIMSVRKAVDGQPETSLANVLGSNIFDLLVCIPAGVLLAGTATVNFTVAAPMMGVLIVGTILLFALMRTDLLLTDREAWVLLGVYGLFVLWLIGEYFHVVNLLPGVP